MQLLLRVQQEQAVVLQLLMRLHMQLQDLLLAVQILYLIQAELQVLAVELRETLRRLTILNVVQQLRTQLRSILLRRSILPVALQLRLILPQRLILLLHLLRHLILR